MYLRSRFLYVMLLTPLFSFLASCGNEEEKEAGGDWEQVIATKGADSAGAMIFQEYCQACHGANGEGTANIYPPLQGSDYLAHKELALAAIVNGLQGAITVKGQKFNGVMPPLPSAYSDAATSAVINYVVKRFGDGSWQTTPEEVTGIRE